MDSHTTLEHSFLPLSVVCTCVKLSSLCNPKLATPCRLFSKQSYINPPALPLPLSKGNTGRVVASEKVCEPAREKVVDVGVEGVALRVVFMYLVLRSRRGFFC